MEGKAREDVSAPLARVEGLTLNEHACLGRATGSRAGDYDDEALRYTAGTEERICI